MAARGKRRVSGPSREKARAGRALSKRPTASAAERFGVSRCEPGRRSELLPGRDRPLEALKRDSVEELGAGVAPRGHSAPAPRAAGRRERRTTRRIGSEARDERRQPRREAPEDEIRRADRVRRVGIASDASAATRRGRRRVSPAQNRARPRWKRAAPLDGFAPAKLLEPLEAPVGPRRERLRRPRPGSMIARRGSGRARAALTVPVRPRRAPQRHAPPHHPGRRGRRRTAAPRSDARRRRHRRRSARRRRRTTRGRHERRPPRGSKRRRRDIGADASRRVDGYPHSHGNPSRHSRDRA